MQIGDQIPSFSAQTQLGTISQADFLGQYTVLYFYPKDNTPGCTTEAQDFQHYIDDFKALGVQVIGISKDTAKTHLNFAHKYQLSFPLIADPDKELCQLFDVMKEKNMYGKKVMGIERSTFVFDPHGKLIHEWRKVKVPQHVEIVLQYLQQQLA